MTPATVTARAPVRLDFAGGWTDVPPFSEREGGLVVNAAIDLRVEATVEPGGEGMLLQAEDLNEALRVNHPAGLAEGARLPLHRAALRMFPVGPCRLVTRSTVPAGAGLGSSGALDVALVAALTVSRGERLDPEEAALNGWQLEVVEAGLAGGRQDQYAAALGGFHLFGFRDPAVEVTPLHLAPPFQAELEQRIVVCYTGRSRLSGDTIRRVQAAYEAGEPAVTDALRGLREVADRMAEALEAGSLEAVGSLLSRNWACQQALDPGMCTPEMRRLEAAMEAAGVLGGKAAGAGAGGCMFFLAGDEPNRAIEAARASGAEVLPCRWTTEGVVSC